jgi:lipoprotein-releasing system permease protein
VALPYEIFVGLRYLRAKRRNRTISLNTVVSIAGITLGVAALIGTVGIMTGFKEDIQAKILGTTAHIIVQDRMKDTMSEYDPVAKQVATVPGVVAATPFVLKQVLLTTQSGVQGIVIRGIDPEREGTVTELAKNLSTGQLADLSRPVKVKQPSADDPTGPAVETEKPGIILGKELALRLGVFVGDTVNVVSPPAGPINAIGMVPKIRTFALIALFQSGMYEYDSSLAYIDLAEAQKFFNMGHTVTGIEIKVADVFHAAETARAVEQSLGFAYGARDWMQMNRNLFSALKLEKTMMFLLLVLITIVASFNIVSTLTMIVTEKQKEIAILKAMGATRKSIRHIFMLNGLIIGLSGTAIGIPLGYAFLWLIQTFWTFDASVYYISQIPVHVQAMDVVLVAGSAIAISFAATVYPSLKPLSSNQWPRCVTNDHASLLIMFLSLWSFGVITVNDLYKSFPMGGQTLTVLKGVNLQIQRGELIAIVGASGAGKSTLLHIIGTLDRPTAGTVHFDGKDIFHMSEGEQGEFRNRRIGFVFQFHHLLPEFTALENACMPALIQRRQPTEIEPEAIALLQEVGLGARLHHKPGELSGGEQQRVAVARALLQKPDLVLADEPTGNLDTHTGEALFAMMRELNKARGTTFVIVTHNDKLSAQADRIVHMQDGQIV